MLKTSVEELTPSKVAITVEVEEKRVATAFSSFFARAAHSVKIPGFRQGRAPRPIIERHLDAEAVNEQICDELLQETLPQALKEANIEPISKQEIGEVRVKEGEPFVYRAVFEIRPKIEGYQHTGLTATVPYAIVDDDSVARALGDIQRRYSVLGEASDEAQLEQNDMFRGKVDASIDGEKHEGLSLSQGWHTFADLSPIFQPILGMKKGEERVFTYVADQEDDKKTDYHGKTVHLTAFIEEVTRVVTPQLDDAFAQQNFSCDTLDALKDKIRLGLEETAKHDAEERAFNDLIDQIIASTSITTPAVLIDRHIDYFLASLDQKWRSMGISFESFLQQTKRTVADLRESFRDKATRDVNVMLMLEAITEREQIKVTDTELRAELETMAAQHNMAVPKFLEHLAKEGGEQELRYSMETRKVRDFLLKNNEVHYDMVKEAELNKGEAEGAGTDSN